MIPLRLAREASYQLAHAREIGEGGEEAKAHVHGRCVSAQVVDQLLAIDGLPDLRERLVSDLADPLP